MQVVVNNHLDTILADAGAKISVYSFNEAKKWKLLDRITKVIVKIKPYNSLVITATGGTRCSVSFGDSSVSVEWHIIEARCEPKLAGKKAKQLGTIMFTTLPSIFQPATDTLDTLRK